MERIALESRAGQAAGLSSDFLGAGADGSIWYGTDKGVEVLNAGKWRHYGQVDGLVWDDCDSRAFLADADGSVWIGTSRGLSRFRRQPHPPLDAPTVTVTGGELGHTALRLDAATTVPHADRYLVVRFTAPVLSDNRDRRYRYRLSNIDRDWVEASQGEARYANLPPGDYTFEVLARNAGGTWSIGPAGAALPDPAGMVANLVVLADIRRVADVGVPGLVAPASAAAPARTGAAGTGHPAAHPRAGTGESARRKGQSRQERVPGEYEP